MQAPHRGAIRHRNIHWSSNSGIQIGLNDIGSTNISSRGPSKCDVVVRTRTTHSYTTRTTRTTHGMKCLSFSSTAWKGTDPLPLLQLPPTIIYYNIAIIILYFSYALTCFNQPLHIFTCCSYGATIIFTRLTQRWTEPLTTIRHHLALWDAA